MFLLSLRQDRFNNSTSKFLGPTPPFSYSKTVIFSLKFSKNDRIRHLRWLVSETRVHQLLENIFLLSLRQDHFSNSTINVLGSTPPFFYFKNSDIFTQIKQKQPFHTSVVACFRSTYSVNSRKYVSTEPKARSFQ